MNTKKYDGEWQIKLAFGVYFVQDLFVADLENVSLYFVNIFNVYLLINYIYFLNLISVVLP
jgi:hypothetical protein